MPARSSHAAALGATTLLALTVGATIASCADDPAQRDCTARIWVPNGDVPPRVAMGLSDWRPSLVPVPHDATWSVLRLDLPAGEYGYSIVRGDRRTLDAQNPLSTYRPDTGEEVSLLIVDDCNVPAIKVESLAAEGGRVSIEGRFLGSNGGAAVDAASIRVETTDGRALAVEVTDPTAGRFRAVGELGDGRATIELEAADEEGVGSEIARARVWPARKARERRDEVLYQVVVDRFRGDGGEPLAPPPTPGARAGGTLDGVRAALEAGHFDALGVTSLWLSPVYDNPDDARPGRDGRLYEGYHGYWVQDGRRVEPKLGGDAALTALVDAAHERGIAVLLDIVPNHVDETNPVVADHREDGWFNPEGCVCGTETCPWGANLQTCWFTDYLPDLRLEKLEATLYEAREAAFWLRTFDVDGVRLDAVPMMPRPATRRIAYELRRSIKAGDEPFIVGEVFTGPGAVALEEIRAQLGADGLDAAFAFPLMWALRGALASGQGSFEEVEALLVAEEDRFAGSGVTVGRILDNHDVPRFLSAANGDEGGDPWEAPAVQPVRVEPYERLGAGLVAIFALPGMPTIFQGDEVGLAGSGDPDNRRVFPRDDELSDEQLALRALTARLGALRACSEALRRGDREALLVERSHYAFSRRSGDAVAIAVLSGEDDAATVEIPAGAKAIGGRWVDALTGEGFDVDASGRLQVALTPRSGRVLLPAGDRCLDAR